MCIVQTGIMLHRSPRCSMRLLLPMMLAGLLLPAQARVVGIWTDIEDLTPQENMTFLETIRQATVAAHSGGLRFAVDAQVGWSIENISADSTRPIYMDVMDIVDEVTLMDYFRSRHHTLLASYMHAFDCIRCLAG